MSSKSIATQKPLRNQDESRKSVNLYMLGLFALLVAYGLFKIVADHRPATQERDTNPTLSLSFLVDPKGILKIDDVIAPATVSSFEPLTRTPDFGYTDAAIWLKVHLFNPASTPITLKITNPLIEQIDVYERPVHGISPVMTHQLGSLNSGDMRRHHALIPLNENTAVAESVVYIRLASVHTMIVAPIEAISQQTLLEKTRREYATHGFFYGSIAVMLLYNAFLAIFLRDRAYALYALLLCTSGFVQASFDGYLLLEVDHNFGNWRTWMNAFGTDIWMLAMLLFSRSFLDLRQRAPLADKLVMSTILITVIMALSVPFLPYKIALSISCLLVAIIGPYLLVTGGIVFGKGFKSALYFVIGHSMFICFAVFGALAMIGILPVSLWNDGDLGHLIKFGTVFDLVFFSFALADRVVQLNLASQKAQASLLAAEIEKRQAQEKAAELAEKHSRAEVLAKMAQILAHDIRQPFSILKIGIDWLSKVEDDPSASKAVIRKLKSNVGRASEEVNGLIADILQVSSDNLKLNAEPVSIETLFSQALTQVFSYLENCQINFSYNFEPNLRLQVDAPKVLRVFANILQNARQAMNGRGEIWCFARTVDSGHFIEITIGNSNSFIDPDEIPQIFGVFYTKSKKGGTGLGLAICQQVVTAHGGSIFCRSDASRGTEFIMTLPASTAKSSISASGNRSEKELPASSVAIHAKFAAN